MTEKTADKPSLDMLRKAKRRPLILSQGDLVKVEQLNPDRALPSLVRPAIEGVRLAAWARANLAIVESRLFETGAILFRGFQVSTAEEFEAFVTAVSGEPLEYRERSSPRHKVSGRIYTSTDYPADQAIFLHNENSYAAGWPMKIFFYCARPAESGGETLIADTRRVFERISPEVRQSFGQRGITYTRNFREALGLSWQTAFQTSDRMTVEKYCRRGGYVYEWKDANRLKTSRVGPAVTRHPRTGEMVWFNHGAFFHVSTLATALRQSLCSGFQEEDLPNNTYYGDGSPIEASVLDEIRDAYRQETTMIPWKKGDVLLLDNMLVAHGRAPYTGSREVLVGMAEPFSISETEPQAMNASPG